MIRELSSAILLIGAMTGIELRTNVSSHTHEQIANPVVSVLSSRDGWGVGAKVAPFALGAIEGHYAFTYRTGEWAFSVLPKFGLSYAEKIRELPQGVQFSMGLQGLASYEQMVIGLEYWHMSNGSALGLNLTDAHNIGLDLAVLQVGYQF